jgi:aminomethyltransferase
MARQTPLYEQHLALQARMIEYAGWLMPVQYRGITAEHLAVRQAAGLFDVSHMGEILVEGSGTAAFLQTILTRDIGDLVAAAADKRVLYSPMCNESGGTIDDLLLYPLAVDRCLLVVNAANTATDFSHISQQAKAWLTGSGNANPVTVSDVSDQYAQLALQGPRTLDILRTTGPATLADLAAVSASVRNYHFDWFDLLIPGQAQPVRMLYSRTGYTGEFGFEYYLPEATPLAMPPAAPTAAAWHWLRRGPNRRALGRAIPCVWRPACPFTAMN